MIGISADATGFEKRAKGFERAEKEMRAKALLNFKAGLYVLQSDAVNAYREVTPVLTGKLQASTVATIHMEGEDTAQIQVRQPATNEQGQEYQQWVIFPHEQWAWGHDTGRMYPGNPYPQRADAVLRPACQRAMQRAGRDSLIEAVLIIKRD